MDLLPEHNVHNHKIFLEGSNACLIVNNADNMLLSEIIMSYICIISNFPSTKCISLTLLTQFRISF